MNINCIRNLLGNLIGPVCVMPPVDTTVHVSFITTVHVSFIFLVFVNVFVNKVSSEVVSLVLVSIFFFLVDSS